MPPIAMAAIPAITAIGSGIANAVAQGNNPGTQAIDQSVGAMDKNAFGYGGGTMSPEQLALRDEHQSKQAASEKAAGDLSRIQAAIQAGQEAAKKPPWFRSDAENAAIAALPGAIQQMPAAAQAAQKASADFKDVDQRMQNAPTLAASEANRAKGLADTARARAPVQGDLSQFNQSRQAFQNDQNPADSMALLKGAAEGTAPSAAQGVLRAGMNQANAQAAGMAAGARGGGGNLAFAAQNAINQQGANALDASNQAAQLRANEMATARGQYASTATANRAQQLQMAGLDADTAMKQANLELGSRQQSASEALGYEQGRQNIFNQNQSGQQAFQTGSAANRIDIEKTNRGLQNKGFENQASAIQSAVTAGGQAVGGLMKPGAFDTDEEAAQRNFRLDTIRKTGKPPV